MGWRYEPDFDDYPPRYRGRDRQVEVPPSLDPIRIMEFMDRLERRRHKNKEKEPKKEERKHVKELLWYFQAACVLYFLSAPIAALQHIIARILN
jgi:hypothetical protein